MGRAQGLDLLRPEPDRCRAALSQADAILHLAARTDVDALEAERAREERGPGWITNVEGTRLLSRIGQELGLPLVYASTDFAFPVRRPGPHSEDEPPAAEARETNWYGWTKREAERIVRETSGRNAIFRISYPYRGPFARKGDHARRVLERYDRGEPIPVFDDQHFTPTFVDEAAAGIEAILQRRLAGVFHLASRDVTTPYEFARRLFEATGRDPRILQRGSFDEYQRSHPTPRPKEGGLRAPAADSSGIACGTTVEAVRMLARQLGAAPRSSAAAPR